MNKIKKTAKESRAITTDLVLPSDTNALNGLFGGRVIVKNG